MTKPIENSLLRSHVTLVVSHSVPENLSRQFARLQDELARQVKQFEGFLGLESSSPEGEDQEEWIIVYRFQNSRTLEGWLESQERMQMVRRIRELTGSEGAVQVLVEPRNKEAVTTVFAHRIKKGCEKDYVKWRSRILEAQRAFDGFLGVESFDPIEGISDQWIDIGHFTSAEARSAWLDSDERKQLLKELEPMAENVSVKPMSSGFDAWFKGSGGRAARETPPPWKQALSVWLGLYPTVMLLTYYFNPLFGSISLPLMMLIGNAASVALLTWVIMKWVNKLLGFWLLPKRKSVALDVLGALGIVMVLLAMYVVFLGIDPAK